MKLIDAKAIVDARHVVACQYGDRDNECAFVEVELGETAYTVWPGGRMKSRYYDTWSEVVASLAAIADRNDWSQMTEDQ